MLGCRETWVPSRGGDFLSLPRWGCISYFRCTFPTAVQHWVVPLPGGPWPTPILLEGHIKRREIILPFIPEKFPRIEAERGRAQRKALGGLLAENVPH